MLKNAPVVPYIPATNVARARRFYEEKVGLVPREEVAGGVVYECGNGSWIFLRGLTVRGAYSDDDNQTGPAGNGGICRDFCVSSLQLRLFEKVS